MRDGKSAQKKQRHRKQHGISIAELIIDRCCQKECSHNGCIWQKYDKIFEISGQVSVTGKQDTEPEHSSQAEKQSIQGDHIGKLENDLFYFNGERIVDQWSGRQSVRIFCNSFIRSDDIGYVGIPVSLCSIDVSTEVSEGMGESEPKPQF